eukprot:395968-Rhodomonas_salina.1
MTLHVGQYWCGGTTVFTELRAGSRLTCERIVFGFLGRYPKGRPHQVRDHYFVDHLVAGSHVSVPDITWVGTGQGVAYACQ